MHWSLPSEKTGTWTAGGIGFILLVSIAYGAWFDALDSICYLPTGSTDPCKSIGSIFGGNQRYQIWNIIGHSFPTVLLLFLHPKKAELFLAAFLISTVVMDSPLWGYMRVQLHHIPLWKDGVGGAPCVGGHAPTTNFYEWFAYYYNPVGTDLVWDECWGFDNFPNGAAIFWSLFARAACAGSLIWWQNKQELECKEFSLLRILKLKRRRKQK